MEQFNDILNDLLHAFAIELSKHKLQKHMTAEEILKLMDIDCNNLPSPKASPGQKQEFPEYDGDDLPEGLSKKRAGAVLALCEAGVPNGMFVHSQNKKIFKPNKQHDKFYKDEKSRIAGPSKDKDVIKWLAKKAGKVGPPPEEEVVPALPSKWNGNTKKAKNLLIHVRDNKEPDTKPYINWTSSRGRKPDEDTLLYNDEFKICGPKKQKTEFLALVAWLQEHPNVVPSSDGKKEKKKVPSKSESSSSSKNSESSSSKNSESSSSKNSESKDGSSSSSSDGTLSSDEEDNFVEGYDAKKLASLKKALSKAKEGEFIDVDSCKPLKPTNKTKKTHHFNKKTGLTFLKGDTAADTKEYLAKVVKMLE